MPLAQFVANANVRLYVKARGKDIYRRRTDPEMKAAAETTELSHDDVKTL